MFVLNDTIEHASLRLLAVWCLLREYQRCHPRHYRPSQDEHQEAIEVEHAGGGQGGMCSVPRPSRPRVRSESGEYSPSLVKFTGLRSERQFMTTFSNMA